jgi:LmbE family N-acetylglucosaminyl deacetylase
VTRGEASVTSPAFTHDGPGTSAGAWSAMPQWAQVVEVDLDAIARVVVVAAHPDDETLGAGGLLSRAHSEGLDVHLVVCTSGEASHPHSATHTPEVLAARRRNEVRAAYAELAPAGALTLVNLGDGQVSDHEATLVELLVSEVLDGRRTLVVAPWRHDGHPDHDAAGRAAATAAHRTGAALWEYPIWWWHWSEPADAPWADLRWLGLSAGDVERRARAAAHHRSQTEPLSDAPGDEALLQPGFLAHFTGSTDRFVVRPTSDDALEALHRDRPDPWSVDERWYERRKRAVTLGLLPRERFARGLEVGCSVGALADDLAGRCDRLVAVDSSRTAAQAARRRLARHEQVEVLDLDVPDVWPEGAFDLVVLSEVGYFLSPRALDALIERVRGALTPDGVLVLCHWRHLVVGWPLDGAAVHAAFVDAGLRPVQARHTERDFEVVALCAPEAWTRANR